MKAPSPRPAYEVDLATLGSRDFAFGTRHHASIHPIAFLRSFGFGFSSLGAVFASPRRSFRLSQKPKTGKLRIFSTFHKQLSEPHLPGRIISPLAFPQHRRHGSVMLMPGSGPALIWRRLGILWRRELHEPARRS